MPKTNISCIGLFKNMAKSEYWLRMAEEDLKDASLDIENGRLEEYSLKGLNNEYAALIQEYLEKNKNKRKNNRK